MADTASLTRHPVESYLRSLMSGCDDVPLIDQLGPDDLGSPCGTAAIARAALSWLYDKNLERIAEQLNAELGEIEQLAKWRTRTALIEFEQAVREHRRDRRHVVPHAELERRRQLTGVA